MPKRYILNFAIIGSVVIAFWAIVAFLIPEDPNVKICLALKPGISVEEISKLMRVDRTSDGWIFFETGPLFFGGGYIAARLDQSKTKVMELECGGEGHSIWKLD